MFKTDSFLGNKKLNFKQNVWRDHATTLVTQPMLQPTPNQTELRLMVSKSFFKVDSKDVSKKFLHHPTSVLRIRKKCFFSI